jgi:putative membrane protein
MNKLWKQGLAGVMTGAMLVSCLAGCSASQDNDTQSAQEDGITVTAEADKVTEAAVSLLGSHGVESGKEETVYVVADAQGDPTQTIVSAWLKNPEEADTIVDSAQLQDIQNVKGDETYTVDSQGNLTWAAQGNDIYYQGTTDKALPVTTTISYELDGKTVTPEELAGASGHLTITFSYTNNTAQEREVDGEMVTLYQPFVVVSGLMLDNDKASAIEVTNGKTINSGEQTIVVGMAMPGLKESLGLDDMTDQDGEPVDVDIPETVTVEADVENFSLLTTVTVMDNSLLADLDLDDVQTMDDLQDAMDDLTDASTQLVDGTRDLYDGVSQLSDGTGDLTDGINTLYTGVGTLDDGAASLSTGAGQLYDGAWSLSSGAAQLETGAYTVSENMDTLYAGLVSLGDGAQQVDDGLAQMQAQVAALPEGTTKLYNGALLVKAALKGTSGQSVYEGAGQLAAGANAIAAGLMSGDEANPGIYEAAVAIGSGADSLSAGAAASGMRQPRCSRA